MYSQRIRDVMQKEHLLIASPQTTVSEAAKLMAKAKTCAVLVIDTQKLVGIFTERDAVTRVIAQERDVRTTHIAEVMTHAPQIISPDKSFGYALLIMYENGFRHLPVVENGKVVGMVLARSALDPDLEEFTAESSRREQILRSGD